MKKFLFLFTAMFFFVQTVFASDVQNIELQEINLENNKAVVSVQKQPFDEKSTQKQTIKNNWFCIILQVNGKIQDSNTTDKQ